MFKLIQEAIDDILWPAVFVMFFWVVYFGDYAYNLGLNNFGIGPRSFQGLRGIAFSPFLHGDFGHLFSNTIPFLVSGSFVFHFFKQMSWKILLSIWFISGFGVWLIGDFYSMHIGASGLVYGLVLFLLTSGIIRRNKQLSAVALILIFLYGSMVWGLLPQISLVDAKISWEGHLFGALSGIGMALLYRHKGPEDESLIDENEEMPLWWLQMQEEERLKKAWEEQQRNAQDTAKEEVKINYLYRRDDDVMQ